MADWPPLRGASFLALFPLYDSTGSLVAAGGGLAACVSKDGAAFAAAACDVAEINANAGLYTLRFSATEMTADVVAWKVITTSASGRPAIGVMYTAASRQLKDLAWPSVAGRSFDVDANGGVEVGSLAASSIVASTFGAGAVDNAAFNVTETLTAIPPASGLAASSFASGAVDNNAWNVTETINASVTAIAASAITASTLGTGALHAAAFAASTLTASKFGASFIELAGLSNAAASFIGTVVRTGSSMGELPVGAPPASPTAEQALMALYMGFRNAASTTSGCIQYTNDGGVVVFKTAISDSGSTFQKGELQSG